jgi:cytoskeletal protein RodZ
MFGCDEFLTSMDDYIEGSLSAEKQAQMDEHRKTCATCRREFEFTKSMLDTLHRMPKIPVPSDFMETLNARLDQEDLMLFSQKKKKHLLRMLSSNWRTYSALAACVLLLVIVKTNAWDVFNHSDTIPQPAGTQVVSTMSPMPSVSPDTNDIEGETGTKPTEKQENSSEVNQQAQDKVPIDTVSSDSNKADDPSVPIKPQRNQTADEQKTPAPTKKPDTVMPTETPVVKPIDETGSKNPNQAGGGLLGTGATDDGGIMVTAIGGEDNKQELKIDAREVAGGLEVTIPGGVIGMGDNPKAARIVVPEKYLQVPSVAFVPNHPQKIFVSKTKENSTKRILIKNQAVEQSGYFLISKENYEKALKQMEKEDIEYSEDVTVDKIAKINIEILS